MEYESIPQMLKNIEQKIKEKDKAFSEGTEFGMQIRNDREEVAEKEYTELKKDPKKFLIKKALYFLEHDKDNKYDYLMFIWDLVNSLEPLNYVPANNYKILWNSK